MDIMEDDSLKKHITETLLSTLRETVKINGLKVPERICEESHLIGLYGLLDSLAFVSFLVAAEQKINQDLRKSISLNNEKAFSQKQNPFKSVKTLTEYIYNLLEENEKKN